MHEVKLTDQSALELRLKQVTRYVSLGLLGVLALCALLFLYIGSVKQNEQTAISNSQTQADQTKDSTFCSIYPNDELCVLSRKIAADPTTVVIPQDGKDGEKGSTGDTGPAGKGVSSFLTNDEGHLIVTFSDGTTQDAGAVIGKNGSDGIDGTNGRGILSAGLDAGNLVIRFSDGTTQNLGMVVGPSGEDGTNGTKGDTGDPGTNGTNGTNGIDGLSVIDLKVDTAGYVQVYYSDGQVKPAGRVIINSISSMACSNDTLTIYMMENTFVSATEDCNPDKLPAAAPAPATQPAPLATIP